MRPHRWQPTRLPYPWDSPGKNTGVGCHFLLQCMKVKSEVAQPLSRVRLLVTPRTAAHQASLSITNSRSLLKLMSIELVMPSNHLILCCPLLLLPSIFPSIRIFSNESVLCIGEGNGNPLQCSCLENPRDRGAWWAAVYGVARGRTRVKRLSSSSRAICEERNGTPLQYSCLENPMDGGAW